MTASGEELRTSSVIGGTCSEMLQTVFLFFEILNALETAKIGDSRDAWNTCVCAYLRMCVPAYLRMCVRAYLRMCVRAYVCRCDPGAQ